MIKLGKIQIRLIVLILTLYVMFLLVISFQRKSEFEKITNYNIEFQQEKENFITSIISLETENIKSLIFENSQWDEMLQYVHTRDKKRVYGNLLSNNKAAGCNYIWIYSNKFELIYSANEQTDINLPLCIVDSIKFQKSLQSNYFSHFFLLIANELVEVFGSPIQPKNDFERGQKPVGFLFYGKIWNDQYIQSLENYSHSKINITNEIAYSQKTDNLTSNLMFIKKNIHDFNGDFLKCITFSFDAQSLLELIHTSNKTHAKNLLIFFIIILILSIFLYLNIAKPMRILSQNFITERFENLTPVLESKTEFREFAELLIKHDNQRRKLQAEMVEKNHMMEQLLLSEAKYKGIIDNMINGLGVIEVITNHDEKVIDFLLIEINATLANMLKLDRETIIGKKLSDINKMSWAFNYLPTFHRVGVIGKNLSGELLLPSNSRYCSISVFSPKKYWCAFIVEDINDKKQAELSLRDTNLQLETTLAELRATQEKLIRNERLKILGQMASGIAHDINNSLTPIIGYIDLLLMDNKNQEISDILKVIKIASLDISNTIEHLRVFYRPKSDKELKDMIQLNELIEDSIELTKHKWKTIPKTLGKEIIVKKELLPSLPNIKGKISDIREALTNLIINACDAMNNNGTLTFKTFVENNKVVFETTDNGCGMDEKTKARCLEPFYTTKGKNGTGLGLAMVSSIVNNHDAILEIESELGKGTKFRFLFDTYEEGDILNNNEDYIEFHHKLKILCIINNDPIFANMIYFILTEQNHNITTSLSIEEGVSVFERENKNNTNFDIVIIDTGMKKINKKETAKKIQSIKSETPVIILTSWLTELYPVSDQPNVFLLNKPFVLKDLNKILNKIFTTSQQN
jgi:signal transduction histidine kinase